MQNVFEEELQRSTIFQDRNVLSPHYVPDHLPHREQEITRIMKTLAPALSQKRPNNLFVYGKTGTGKTSSLKHVLEKLEEVKAKYSTPVDYVYVNCHTHNTKYQVLIKIAEKLKPGEDFRGYQPTHLHDLLLKEISRKKMFFFVVLDEVDKVKDLNELMYLLTRANDELPSSCHVGVIGISNNLTFKEKLDARAKSTLCQEEMVFDPYDAKQLVAILGERVEKGFRKGAVDDKAVAIAAAFSAQDQGDARYALRLLIKAGELADANGGKLREEEVRAARSAVEEDIVLDAIQGLNDQLTFVLYAIAELTQNGGSRYGRLQEPTGEVNLYSGEVYEKYESVTKKFGKQPKSARWYREYLNDLETMGLITTTMSGPGTRGQTLCIKLQFPADKVTGAVKKRFE
jgi:cell division control protein 6